jgi:septum formation protein
MRPAPRQLDSVRSAPEHAPVLVLASASPRRRQLLAWLGVSYDVLPAEVDERPLPGEATEDLVARLACAKAAHVAARRPADWVLAADTVVELDGVALGKPADRTDAARMIAMLAGREHRVATGVALVAPGGAVRAARLVLSRVRFRPLEARAVERYVATGEGDDKAGAYAVQGLGAGLIERVDGSFTNVIGLPLGEVERVLEEAHLLAR